MHVIRFGATTPGHWSEKSSSGDVQYWIPEKTTTTTPAKVVQPPADTTGACNMLWNQLVGQAPAYVKTCITYPTHKRVFDGICARIGSGATTLQQGAAQWAGYVTQECPAPATPPARSTPPSTSNAPPPPPTSQPAVPPPTVEHDLPSGPGGDTTGAPSEDTGYLRQVGSIVGVGLILAVGLTYARKKGMLKLTKRRTRR